MVLGKYLIITEVLIEDSYRLAYSYVLKIFQGRLKIHLNLIITIKSFVILLYTIFI